MKYVDFIRICAASCESRIQKTKPGIVHFIFSLQWGQHAHQEIIDFFRSFHPGTICTFHWNIISAKEKVDSVISVCVLNDTISRIYLKRINYRGWSYIVDHEEEKFCLL